MIPVAEVSGGGRDGWVPAGPVAVSGPLLFARYAYGPNRLGYCGPADSAELFDLATALRDGPDDRQDRELRRLAGQFEGAWPYLELIARSNGVPDPLDPAVVEAYWLGNELLEQVGPNALGPALESRFRPRLGSDAWRLLATKPAAGARPVHAFHVLDVFPRTGLLRGDQADDVMRVINGCRIRWGRAQAVDGDWLLVSTVPIVMVAGRLTLGAPIVERVQAWRDGTGFVSRPAPGDVVSMHWGWACDRLDGRRLAGLVRWTRRELEIANQTV